MSNVTHKNILAIKDHSELTRTKLRELEVKLTESNNRVKELTERLGALEIGLSRIQVKLFSGGTTHGN